MTLSKNQIAKLVSLIAKTGEEGLGCECCFKRIAEFADAEREGRSLCETLKAVKNHLESCPCCADEYKALKECLDEMTQNEC